VQIEGVNTKEDVAWYCGKRMAYIYKAKTKSSGTHYRCIWGKVTRPHGNSGVVRAKFRSNLPPESMVSWSALPVSIRCYVPFCTLCSVLILLCCPPLLQGRKVRVFMYPSSI
jgi:large subunit ribosomal protein L35Ae